MDTTALLGAIQELEKAYAKAKTTDLEYGVQAGAPPIAPWPRIPCRLVFLDFDGVLNQEIVGARRDYFLPRCIAALNEIILATGAWLIISSSWRLTWTLAENAATLERAGVLPGRVLGKTPMLGRERGHEIAAWLKQVPYAVERFVILDNQDDMVHLRPHLVQTQSAVGLTAAEAARAIVQLRPRPS